MGAGIGILLLEHLEVHPSLTRGWRNACPVRGSMFGGGSVESTRCETSACYGILFVQSTLIYWLSSTDTPPLPAQTWAFPGSAQVPCHPFSAASCPLQNWPQGGPLCPRRRPPAVTSKGRLDAVAAKRLSIWQAGRARALWQWAALQGKIKASGRL